LGAHLTILKG